jgi:hypothetical protein
MDFEGEGFKEFSRTSGKLRFESDGEVQEKDYSAVNYINAAANIGYSEVTVEGKPDSIFVSRTVDGIVLTMPGEQAGPAPFPVEGYLTLTIVASGSGPKAFYEAHVQAIGEEPLLSDRAWLEKEVPVLGQRALDVMMKIFAQVVKQMDEMMSGLGSAMGEMMEGMGKAMGEAMEGVGKAMGEALGGGAEEEAPRKAALAPPEMAVKPKAPARKARPASKAAPKKKAKPKAAPKKKVKPKAAPKKKAKPKAAPRKKAKPRAVPKKKAKPARKAKAPARKPTRKGGKKRK